MKTTANLLHCVRSKECPVARTIRLSFGIVAALGLAVLLTGCGRKGPLDPPPGASQLAPAAPAGPAAPVIGPDGQAVPAQPGMQQEFDEYGRPIAPAGRQRRLFLDWLLD
jgi:predicted small lipoprotein YifL